jgi:hypothetical protein
MLNSTLEGRRKLYRVNALHPLASDITSIVRKVSGIDALVERVTANLPSLEQVWICGDLARGVESKTIDSLLIGEQLDHTYIGELSNKVEKLTGKKVQTQIFEHMPSERVAPCLLVWQKEDKQ